MKILSRKSFITVLIIPLLALGFASQMASAVSHTITGTIRDASGNSLSGAYVYATAPSAVDPVAGPVTTNINGAYTLPITTPGTYDLHFIPPTNKGYGPIVDTSVSVTSNQTINHNFSSQMRTLSGTLTDGSGTPLPYVTVKLGSTQTSTDLSGQYSLAVPAGSYPLYVSGAMNGIQSFTLQQSTSSINLVNTNQTLNLSIKTATMTVTPRGDNGQIRTAGSVTARATGGTTSLYPGDPGTTVSLVASDGFTANGAAGIIKTIIGATYAASGLDSTSSQTSVCESARAYDCLQLPLMVMGDTSYDLPSPAPAFRTFSGTVTDSSGAPLPSVTVALLGDGTATSVTDANGNFSITAKPKQYAIKVTGSTATLPSFTLAQNTANPTVDLRSDNVTRNLQVKNTPLTISVIDSQGNPLNNRLVMVQASAGSTTLYAGDPGTIVSMAAQNIQPAGSNTGTLETIIGASYTGRGLNQPNYYGSLCARNSSNTYDCLTSAYTVTGPASINVISQ